MTEFKYITETTLEAIERYLNEGAIIKKRDDVEKCTISELELSGLYIEWPEGSNGTAFKIKTEELEEV